MHRHGAGERTGEDERRAGDIPALACFWAAAGAPAGAKREGGTGMPVGRWNGGQQESAGYTGEADRAEHGQEEEAGFR